tara:strand:- start:1246 stop:1458 length:213 start_codon:yes stop_codon:yes gene_type:complete
MILDVLKTERGRIVMSIVLGLGLAVMFRRICSKDTCLIIKGPKGIDIKDFHYKIDKTCYKYNPYPVNCDT